MDTGDYWIMIAKNDEIISEIWIMNRFYDWFDGPIE